MAIKIDIGTVPAGTPGTDLAITALDVPEFNRGAYTLDWNINYAGLSGAEGITIAIGDNTYTLTDRTGVPMQIGRILGPQRLRMIMVSDSVNAVYELHVLNNLLSTPRLWVVPAQATAPVTTAAPMAASTKGATK